jgi:hypothetical protein
MATVTSARYIEEYKVFLTFSDGKAGVADLKEILWGDVFEPLRDTTKFKNFTVSPIFETICWENGADIAPEYLYDRTVEKVS